MPFASKKAVCMIKETSVSTTTPSQNLPLAEAILGKEIAAQTRWSPGALVAAIFAGLPTRQVTIVTPDKVRSYDCPNGVPSGVRDGFPDYLGYLAEIKFVASGEGRSKSINNFDERTLFVELRDDQGDAVSALGATYFLEAGIMLPSEPTYTLLSLVNRLEGLCVQAGRGFLFMIDQEGSGEITVVIFDTVANSKVSDVTMAAKIQPYSASMQLSVAFNTEGGVIPTTSLPSYGWE